MRYNLNKQNQWTAKTKQLKDDESDKIDLVEAEEE
jgi:hypothetical protein